MTTAIPAAEIARNLVIANRILGHEGIVDAWGHVSVRHPDRADRFLLSRARAPELVEEADLLEFSLDGEPVAPAEVGLYSERFIHAAVYEARPDVTAVCHNHALSVLPFSISRSVRLTPVVHTGSYLGGEVPVWDIADEFGTSTTMLVETVEQGRSLSRTLANGPVALMRGHGSVVAGANLEKLVTLCMAMDRNAKVQLQAAQLGEVTPLHPGEVATRLGRDRDSRAWEYWSRRAGF
jgi:HCOMODA/2-hydroxy-3-carboxy-muconic semialdehyde decarboxylase